MTKVTNNHSAPLNVAGIDVRPGASVAVPDDAFKKWSHGNAAKQWLKAKIITADAKVDVSDVKPAGDDLTERQKLEAQADALGIAFTPETSDDDLVNALTEAQEQATVDERESLMTEARSLGLNPNVNTGVAKLKKMIADKKAL